MTGRPIAFITDLGLHDDAVGMCKGLMLQISPTSPIIDITHDVTPFDVEEGALYVQDLSAFFPDGTVFCCVIYPETGSSVPTLAVENQRGQVYVGPDNGVFSFALDVCHLQAAYQVTNPAVIREPPTPSFYGRDVVVSCAAHLAAGFPVNQVGPRIDDIVHLSRCDTACIDGSIYGKVTIIDKNFGNLWTNITREILQSGGLGKEAVLGVQIGDVRYKWSLVKTFADVPKGRPLAYFNSRDRLAFGLNQGNLAKQIDAVRGLDIRILRLSAEEQERDRAGDRGGMDDGIGNSIRHPVQAPE